MWTVEPLVLSVQDRCELERRVRGSTTAHRDRLRAGVGVVSAGGVHGPGIPPQIGVSGEAGSGGRPQRPFLTSPSPPERRRYLLSPSVL